MDQDREKREEQAKNLEVHALEGAAAETVQRYGSAVKQHFVAYSGVDNETGERLTKGLKSISDSKINPNYRSQNIKQQAGFAAEVKSVARKNAQNIVEGKKSRYVRTDDLGKVNDPLLDLVEVAGGKEIAGTGSQMKFVGKTPDDLLDKFHSKKYQKYIDGAPFLDVADDDYDALMGRNGKPGLIDERNKRLKEQIDKTERAGRRDVAVQKEAEISKNKKIKEKLRGSGVTRDEAIEARLYPKVSTAKDVAVVANKAGKEQLKTGLKISGSVSVVKNLVACMKGDKTPEEAAASVVIDTGTGAAVSYATAFSGATIKGAMQNSQFGCVKELAKTNLPAQLVTTTMDVGKALHKYFKGDISGAECVEELGERGVGEIGSAMFATIGAGLAESQMMAVVGGLAGATLGYAAAVACYREISTALKDAELARTERIRIERECAEAVALIHQYRQEMDERMSKYFTRNIETFHQGFLEMDKAVMENDPDGFIRGNVKIQELLGREVQFSTQKEFDALMMSDTVFKF